MSEIFALACVTVDYAETSIYGEVFRHLVSSAYSEAEIELATLHIAVYVVTFRPESFELLGYHADSALERAESVREFTLASATCYGEAKLE